MELRQIKYFAKSAELLNFSDAARALNVAQSTLSQQVRQLETELNVQLFERNARSVRLTEAGEALLPYARRILYDAESCLNKVRDLGDIATGELNIGVTYSFSPILTETLVEFTRQYPGVKLNVFYHPMSQLMELLSNHKVDFALAFRPSRGIEGIESHVLFDNHLSVIVRNGHPLTSHKEVALADLADYHIALPTKGLQARNAFELVLASNPTPLDIKIELNEVNILLELIKRSNMVTVLAEATVYNQQGVTAIPLAVPGNEMEGCVHMLRNSYRKHSAMKFISMLRDSDAVRARVHNWFM